MGEFESIKVTEEEGLAYIELAREPLNVLNIAMMEELNTALDELILRKDLKAVVFHSKGKAFSAGVDVGEHMGDMATRMIEVFHGIFRKMTLVEVPTVALVKGAALGGGCELAIFCDLVLASEKARFGQPEIQVGVFPPIAALEFPNLMHMNKALELVLTGDMVKAKEACEMGLVNQVYSLDEFDEKCQEFLAKLKSLSAPVIRLSKKAVYRGAEGGLMALKDIEAIYLDELMQTHDAHEGLSAFLEKRKPVWEDR